MSLPLPPFFDPAAVSRVYRVPYQERAAQAGEWAAAHRIRPSSGDDRRVALLLVDAQNTFCLPEFELFVGGRSGRGAIEDCERIAALLYRHLPPGRAAPGAPGGVFGGGPGPRHYARRLAEGGKYPLVVWPYHSMVGGIGHAMVSAVEEAVFFHAVARQSPTRVEG